MRDPRERLRDILDAIGRIERYAVRGRLAFEEGELIRGARPSEGSVCYRMAAMERQTAVARQIPTVATCRSAYR